MTATAAVAGVTPFLHLDQRDLNRQTFVGKHAGEMDQFVEDIHRAAPLGAQPPVEHFSAFCDPLDDPLPGDDRFDDGNVVRFEQMPDLIANGRQRPVLDFKETRTNFRVDAILAQRHLTPGIGPRIETF